MANLWTTEQTALNGAFRRFRFKNLKSCPVCSAVNAKQNAECFVCGWSGRFDEDQESIERGLSDLIDRCPEIAEILIDRQVRRVGIVERVIRLFRRRPRVDFTV